MVITQRMHEVGATCWTQLKSHLRSHAGWEPCHIEIGDSSSL